MGIYLKDIVSEYVIVFWHTHTHIYIYYIYAPMRPLVSTLWYLGIWGNGDLAPILGNLINAKQKWWTTKFWLCLRALYFQKNQYGTLQVLEISGWRNQSFAGSKIVDIVLGNHWSKPDKWQKVGSGIPCSLLGGLRYWILFPLIWWVKQVCL